MPRPALNNTSMTFNVSPTTKQAMGQLVLKLGYCYDGKPAWGKFFDAIVSGELVIGRSVAVDK